MEITRREGLRLLAVLGGFAALPGGLVGCADDEALGPAGPRPAGPGELEVVRSGLGRGRGSVPALPDAAASVATLGAGLFGALREQPGNLVLSPYSVAVALAMGLNGAAGETAAEMGRVLGVDDLPRFNGGLNALTQYVEGLAGRVELSDGTSADLVLAAANQLFGQRDTTWAAPFLDTLARDYGAGMRLVDYVADPEGARSLINGWTAEQTRDRIPEIVPEGVLDELTRLVLVNALYLKAPWDVAFEPERTELRAFRTEDGRSVEVPTMMRGLDTAGYAQRRRLGGGPDPLRRAPPRDDRRPARCRRVRGPVRGRGRRGTGPRSCATSGRPRCSSGSRRGSSGPRSAWSRRCRGWACGRRSTRRAPTSPA